LLLRSVFHTLAARDVSLAQEHYRREAGALTALRFLHAIDTVLQRLSKDPDLGTPLRDGRRVHPLRVFPYSVVYRVEADRLKVLVVRHQHRRPGFGDRRQ
jgi:toxin ParE1/3/4